MAAETARRIVDEEIGYHLEQRIAELESAGWSGPAARREAARRFGDMEATLRVCVASDVRRERRMKRREEWLDAVRDARHALRQLRRRRAFALLAVATLATGIGATTAIFSAADHILFRPLPFEAPERVVTVWQTDRSTGEMKRHAAPGNFVEWERRTRTLSAMGLAEPFGFDLTGDGWPVAVTSWAVTPEFLTALGVEPMLGRDFTAEEHRVATAGTDEETSSAPPPAVLLSYELWRDRFGADSAIVGRTIGLNGGATVVVGVLPSGLDYPERRDLWSPKRFYPGEDQDRSSDYMLAVGRLAPGVTLAQAQRDLDRIAAELAAEYPATNGSTGISAVPLETHVLGPVRPALLVLLGAVSLVLLIACANVAGLLLAHGAERSRELGVRAALGAGRARLLRQLSIESGLLGVAGGLVGLLLAYVGVRLFVVLSPPELPRVDAITVDARILGFAAAATLATVVLFGLLPALRLSRPSLLPILGSGSRTSGHSRTALRSALVVGEVALALVLLAGAGLLGRSFVALLENDPGFAVEDRATIQLFLWDLNPTAAERLQRVAEYEAAFVEVPGVERVGLTSALPFHPTQIDVEAAVIVDDRPAPEPGTAPLAQTTIASPQYFDVMGIPLLNGRLFTAWDRADAPRVALINRTLADRLFPGESPLGRRVTVGVMARPISREIVGIVGDVRPTSLSSDPRPELYVPYAQAGHGSVTFVIDAAGAAALLPALRDAVWQVDPDQAVYHAATVETLITSTLVERRFHLALLGLISGVALLLATIGIYGLIAVTTRERRGEIGIRMALGARRGAVTGLIVGQALRLVVPGVLIGTLGALALTRSLRSMLYRVSPSDPATLVIIAFVTLAAAAVAALLPARRAAATDPMLVLRQE